LAELAIVSEKRTNIAKAIHLGRIVLVLESIVAPAILTPAKRVA